MSFFSFMYESLAAGTEKRARVLVLDQLRNMPARELRDLGFDPLLLEDGVSGWPWRVQESDDLTETNMGLEEGSRFQTQYKKCESERNAAASCSSEEELRADEQQLSRVA